MPGVYTDPSGKYISAPPVAPPTPLPPLPPIPGVGGPVPVVAAGPVLVGVGVALAVAIPVVAITSGNAAEESQNQQAQREDAIRTDATTRNANAIKARDECGCDPFKIANGHAYDKHVLFKGEFPGIRTRQQFLEVITEAILQGERKSGLERGRSGFWLDGVLVVCDPNHPDEGTAFAPDEGRTYFDTKLK